MRKPIRKPGWNRAMAFVLGLLIQIPHANATTVFTTESAFLGALTGGYTTIDFDDKSHLDFIFDEYPGVDFSGTGRAYDEQSLPSGGAFNSAPNVLLNVGIQPIEFTFDSPVDGVGLYNTSIADAERMRLFDADGNTLFDGGLPASVVSFLGFVSDVPILSGEVVPAFPTNGTIFIDDFSFGTVDATSPPTDPGESPENPILPEVGDDPEDGFDFPTIVVRPDIVENRRPIFFDPVVTVGYDYLVSDNRFTGVELPVLGDGVYEISFWDDVAYVFESLVTGGSLFVFDTPVSRFLITGIEADLGVDPTDPLAFVTGLTFESAGSATVRMVPVTNSVPAPEPAMLVMIGLLTMCRVSGRARRASGAGAT